MLYEALEAVEPLVGLLIRISLFNRDAYDVHQGLHKGLLNGLGGAVGLLLLARLTLPSHSVDNRETRGLEAEAVRGRSLLDGYASWPTLLIHQHLNIISVIDAIFVL